MCSAFPGISICHLSVVFHDKCQSYKYKKQSRKIYKQKTEIVVFFYDNIYDIVKTTSIRNTVGKHEKKILRQSSSSTITQLGSVAFDCGRLYFERQIFHRNKVDGQFLSYYLLSSEEIDKIYFGSDFDSAGWIQISLTTLTKLTPPKRVSIFHRNNVTGQFLIRNW